MNVYQLDYMIIAEHVRDHDVTVGTYPNRTRLSDGPTYLERVVYCTSVARNTSHCMLSSVARFRATHETVPTVHCRYLKRSLLVNAFTVSASGGGLLGKYCMLESLD